ncbi:MAG: hypothetical protein K2H38_13410 [Muribaculaceae bacterium]|nr:hypothetical protein [Muribaculaceae bacterium]MDE6552260.1 hypothetical protein [Muribaculaceae bacterium]
MEKQRSNIVDNARHRLQQLRVRSLAGKAIALAGISGGMILMLGCCGTGFFKQPYETLQGGVILKEECDSIDEDGKLPSHDLAGVQEVFTASEMSKHTMLFANLSPEREIERFLECIELCHTDTILLNLSSESST